MLNIYLSMLDTPEEKDKFEELYLKYNRLMKYVSNQILKDEQLAEDAVHIAFMRIIDNFQKIGEVNCHKTKSFIVIVIKSVSKDMYRFRKKHVTETLEDNVDYLVSQNNLLSSYEMEIVTKKIDTLPDIYREVLLLRYFHHYGDKEIAKLLDIKDATVRKRLERARGILAKKLMDEGEII